LFFYENILGIGNIQNCQWGLLGHFLINGSNKLLKLLGNSCIVYEFCILKKKKPFSEDAFWPSKMILPIGFYTKSQ
jgi:hypothetical protein